MKTQTRTRFPWEGETLEKEALYFAAQIWCRPENGDREMDADFAVSIAEAVKPLIKLARDSRD